MKKQAFLVLLLGVLALTGCNSGNANQNNESKPASDNSVATSSEESGLKVAEDLGEFDTHTELQQQYLADSWDSILTYVPKVNAEDSSYHNDQSQPVPVTLDFDELEQSEKYYVEISKDLKFDNTKVYETTTRSYDFYNGLLGQQYYFRAANERDDLAEAPIKAFKIKDLAPRYIHVDGVINFRDCGGWASSLVDGAKVKQGMYYRCAQFNSGSTKNITAEGLKTIQELGIKVDIDMRDSYNVPSTSPISTDDWEVEIMKASVASSTEDGRWEGDHSRDHNIAATYKAIFEAIAVSDEKPIALHCTHGADRTGIVSWFLLGLLGVSKEDCARDYVMTRFAGERAVLPYDVASGTNKGTSELAKWNSKTEALEGATWADKTYKHLNEDFGIEVDTLETIREKFVPGYVRAA